MLKVIFRIVLILLAAGIVSGGLIFWVNTSGISQAGGGFDRQALAGQRAARPAHDFEGGGRDSDFAGGAQLTRGLQDMAAKIGIIALITAGVAILQHGIGWITRRRQPDQALTQS
jgi:hypothetical protein